MKLFSDACYAKASPRRSFWLAWLALTVITPELHGQTGPNGPEQRRPFNGSSCNPIRNDFWLLISAGAIAPARNPAINHQENFGGKALGDWSDDDIAYARQRIDGCATTGQLSAADASKFKAALSSLVPRIREARTVRAQTSEASGQCQVGRSHMPSPCAPIRFYRMCFDFHFDRCSSRRGGQGPERVKKWDI